MYQAVVNSQNMNQLNNYQFTNRNFSVKPCQGVQTSSGQPYSELNQVSSYKTYMDLAIGKRLVNPVLNGQEALSLEGNMGAFYRLNVVANDSISTAQANNGSSSATNSSRYHYSSSKKHTVDRQRDWTNFEHQRYRRSWKNIMA